MLIKKICDGIFQIYTHKILTFETHELKNYLQTKLNLSAAKTYSILKKLKKNGQIKIT